MFREGLSDPRVTKGASCAKVRTLAFQREGTASAKPEAARNAKAAGAGTPWAGGVIGTRCCGWEVGLVMKGSGPGRGVRLYS